MAPTTIAGCSVCQRARCVLAYLVEVASQILVERTEDGVGRLGLRARGQGDCPVPPAAVVEVSNLAVDIGVGLPLGHQLRPLGEALEIAGHRVGRGLPRILEGLPGSSCDQCQALIGLCVVGIDPGIRGGVDRGEAAVGDRAERAAQLLRCEQAADRDDEQHGLHLPASRR